MNLKQPTSLDEKNILIKEIHHRVKNNMQHISSILALKAYDSKDENFKIIFEEINIKVRTISIIYDILYKFYDVSKSTFKDFLMNILHQLYVLLGISEITIGVEVTSESLPIDQVLLIGLTVSEMVSYAVKHSFGESSKGTIKIHFNKRKKGKYYLSVVSNGKRVSNDVLSRKISLSISLIKTFAKQLKEILSIDEKTVLKLSFKYCGVI
ncbi:MAG: histidine kinase dimerization/phosphoacceptor domain -containing protein [Bacteroidota bacterium]